MVAPHSPGPTETDGVVGAAEDHARQVQVVVIAVAGTGLIAPPWGSGSSRGVVLLVLVNWVSIPLYMASWYSMTWDRFTAVGLKPPPREHVVATGRLTAGLEEWRRPAESHPPLPGVAEDAVVDPEDHDDQVLVGEAVIDEAGLVVSSMR